MFNSYTINLFAWISLFFYFICFIPQIIENYRLKSTCGLSVLSIISYFIGYASVVYYIYCLDLLLPYKAIVPFEFSAMIIIVLQRFYYEGLFADKIFFWVIVGTTISFFAVFPLALLYPQELGAVCGWIAFAGFLIHPIPQVLKIFREKSVEGFSFGFVSLLAVAVSFELIVSVVLGLPIQTSLMAIKGLAFYVIFCFQFWLYKSKSIQKMSDIIIKPCLSCKDKNKENIIGNNIDVCLTCSGSDQKQA